MTPFLRAALVLGVGVGGFFDGIVLHQILQWHHVLSDPVRPDSLRALEVNTLADGLFHAATWVITVVGLFVLVRAYSDRRPTEGALRLTGGMFVGWGLFNVVEGVIDHHVLQLHHVRPGPDELLYDVGFLLWGALMIVAGTVLLRRDHPIERPDPRRGWGPGAGRVQPP